VDIHDGQPKNNLIFVVDESVRWDHLSLNGYGRSTTPFLEKLRAQGKLYNWGLAVAGATMSVSANLLLLTGVQRAPDTAQNYRRWPTLFQFAHAMGYETYHIDAQTERRWLLSDKDLAEVDHWITRQAFHADANYDVDFAAARYARQQVDRTTGKMIWMTKMGLHFPYVRRLPLDQAAWRPISSGSHYDPSRRTEIINTYDSALAYNLDRFFEELLGPDGLENTVIVYTSDHGQTLSDHGEPWPHTGGTPNEVSVPLFIVSDRPLSVDTTYPASHANLFATLLDLMGAPEDALHNDHAVSLLKARGDAPVQRYYLNGDLESEANGKAVLFDRDRRNL
jgi:glucan phosphoethanolaminetransferase (alkaline phosphatase superfamily)